MTRCFLCHTRIHWWQHRLVDPQTGKLGHQRCVMDVYDALAKNPVIQAMVSERLLDDARDPVIAAIEREGLMDELGGESQ